MKDLNHSQALAADGECARPRAQRLPNRKPRRCFPVPFDHPALLRPGTGAPRLAILCALCVLLWQSALAEVHYVDLNSTNATPPYTNWATAATNIQDAVDAAVAGDEVVVTNGTYSSGGRATTVYEMNRVLVDKPLSLRSVNGPKSTIIQGGYSGGYTRCVHLTNTVSLSGFTLSNGIVGMAGYYAGGAGAYGGTLNNCVLTGNSAEFLGGGAMASTLNNCTLTANYAGGQGAGVFSCTLNNCTVAGNTCPYGQGGGASACTLNNCIVYFNTAAQGANYDWLCTVNYCCTTPETNGFGNISNAPLFVDTNGWANLRLQPNSPCINAGNNSYATNAIDLDGNPRIAGGTVDIGAYEYQCPQLTLIPYGAYVLLTWPTNFGGYNFTGFTLESTTNLASPAVWSTNAPAPIVIGNQNVVIAPLSGPQQFYRLIQ